MTNTYIQDKLNELIDTYRKETGFTEYDARMIAERLVADYHNHIVEKIKQLTPIEHKDVGDSYGEQAAYNQAIKDFLSLLQDTNPKE